MVGQAFLPASRQECRHHHLPAPHNPAGL